MEPKFSIGDTVTAKWDNSEVTDVILKLYIPVTPECPIIYTLESDQSFDENELTLVSKKNSEGN